MTRYYVCRACMLGRLCQFCHEPGIITADSDGSDETGDSDADCAYSAVRTTSGDSSLGEDDEAFCASTSDSASQSISDTEGNSDARDAGKAETLEDGNGNDEDDEDDEDDDI